MEEIKKILETIKETVNTLNYKYDADGVFYYNKFINLTCELEAAISYKLKKALEKEQSDDSQILDWIDDSVDFITNTGVGDYKVAIEVHHTIKYKNIRDLIKQAMKKG